MPTIVFVCTGNTCRSPMAELLFNKKLKNNKLMKEKLRDWQAISVGISAFSGQQISKNAAKVLEEDGVDSKKHISRELSEGILQDADLVLTMTVKHKEQIILRFPQYSKQVFTLKEYSLTADSNGYDILDPYGQSEDIYIQTKQEILEELKGLIGKLS